MELKEWTYEDMPEFTGEVPGAEVLQTTGDEIGVKYIHDVEYAVVDGISLHLQILYPFSRNVQQGLYPCIVYVQGSAWREQDVWYGCPLLSNLAKKGYVIAVVQYRHSGQAVFPAQIQDARNAVRFMRMHAEEYNIDPEQMLVAGSSSGGHTCMFAGMLQEGEELDHSIFPGVSAKVKGIINYYGAVSFLYEDGFPSTPNHHLPGSPESELMGNINMRDRRDLCEKGTVSCYITPEREMPPVMILHGTKDRLVNTIQSVDLYHKLMECGKDARLLILKGADHGGAEFWSDEVCNKVDEFIQYCLNK